MNRVKAGSAMFAVMVAAAGPGLLADAKGRVNVKGASFTVADAVAYKDDDNIEIISTLERQLPTPLWGLRSTMTTVPLQSRQSDSMGTRFNG